MFSGDREKVHWEHGQRKKNLLDQFANTYQFKGLEKWSQLSCLKFGPNQRNVMSESDRTFWRDGVSINMIFL